jgi:hypothetical protein
LQRRQRLESILLPIVNDGDNLYKRRSYDKDQDYKLLKQHSPSKVLSGGMVRAAMNIYTANLDYGNISNQQNNNNNPSDIYTVTDPAWKKAYIRENDKLPDVQQVIAADLDVRDLYRNQVQQKLEDAAAELYYNRGSGGSNVNLDVEEVRTLLQEAAQSFDLWLDRIADEDVKSAIQAAMEGKELKVYEPFTAGFLPLAR